MQEPRVQIARDGLVEYGGKWSRLEATKADLAMADLLVEHKDRRLKTPVKVDAYYKLALWCINKDLVAESRAHLATVVRLEPNHAEVWKKLGYKKVGRIWIDDADFFAGSVAALRQRPFDAQAAVASK